LELAWNLDGNHLEGRWNASHEMRDLFAFKGCDRGSRRE